MDRLDCYLEKLYLYEQVKYIDEGFISWAKKTTIEKVINRMNIAIKQKDVGTIQKILKVIPKVEPSKLYQIGKRAHKDFDKAYKIVKKEAINIFPDLNDKKLEYFSLMITPKIALSKDIKSTAKKEIKELNKKLKKAGAKKFGAEGGGIIGIVLIILAGALFATAITHLVMFPLLIGIIIVAFGGMFALEGAT
jgi:hypothetical protein